MVPALPAASGDSSPQRDHSPGSRPHARSGARHRRLCRASTGTDSSFRSRPSPALRSRACAPTAFASLNVWHQPGCALRSLAALKRRWACGARSRGFARASAVSKATPWGCLIVAPAPAGGRRRARLRPSAPQGLARCAVLHLALTVLDVGIPPGRPILGRLGGVRVARPATAGAPVGALISHHKL